ncbi:MAG TPA: hypothetical protein VE224_14995 [Pseudolabrys sp.]|nr:hypothetical protein [Pseudolabrys sp.]
MTGPAGDGGAISGAAAQLIAGSPLTSLAGGRSGVARIEAALKSLRDTLAAARAGADPVPGDTTLAPVTASISHYVDQATYVTINGQPVQNGTVTVALDTETLVVGYQRVARAPLAVRDAVKALSTTVANVVAAEGADGGAAGAFARNVSALLKNGDFNQAVTAPDTASLDSALSQIDGALAGAAGFGFGVQQRAAAAAQVDFGGLLLGASARFTGAATPSMGASAYQSSAATDGASTVSNGTFATTA